MPPREATIDFETDLSYDNVHFTENMNCGRLYSVRTPSPRNPDNNVQDMGATARALEKIISDAIAAKATLRAAGGGWSLSNASFSKHWLLDTQSMNLKWRMKPEQVLGDYTKPVDKLYLFQCGNSVQEVNKRLEGDGNSLSTCGASNGQTIAGAIATGTHGSAYQYGSMTQYVAGMHIVAGPGNTIWLERASQPVVTDAFITSIGAKLVREDAMFNAALVGFGSFGIVAGILIESEAKYELECSRQLLHQDATMRTVMNSMQTNLLTTLPRPDTIPWHFEITFNPHDASNGYARTMYKRPFDDERPANPTPANGSVGPGEGMLSVISVLTGIGGPRLIAGAVGLLTRNNLKISQHPFTGACSEIFATTTLRGKAMSMELGIAMENSTKVLDLILSLHPEIDVYAGVISYRWVKQGAATLGWTKFPVTATIEFNAAHNSRTLDFYNRIWSELEAAGIEYTLHWGQMNNFTPARVRNMYGNAVDQWKSCRDALLSPEAKAVFTNDFMISCGLD